MAMLWSSATLSNVLRSCLVVGLTATASCSSGHSAHCPAPTGPAPRCVFDAMHVDAKSTATWTAFRRAPGASAVGDHQPSTFEWSPLNFANVAGEGTVATDHLFNLSCRDR